MNVLGIETSCDETSVAVVQNGRQVLSNTTISSLSEHKRYGGIIPEIASRRQLECIYPVLEQSLAKAQLKLNDIDAVAVTTSPGLIGSLLVGTSFARGLSYSLQKTLIKVNHIHAHLYANFLTGPNQNNQKLPSLPAVGLVVSGGHTSLYYLKDFYRFKLLGATLDDAAGEAFDKTARILDLGYPGGPAIDRLAKTGYNNSIHFNPAKLPGTYNFSFSGVKTAVLYHHQKHQKDLDYSVEKVAFSFQDSIVRILVEKSIRACLKHKVKTLVVGGGVAANSRLREELLKEGKEQGLTVYFPAMEYCLDNAAMIAGLGFHELKK
ncbi:MAG: tRNA (adenosine(37)-N6)-threonylcarbamoyltransferase complex transferase subunit TsaD [Candidatus Omnitrophica bacterium]|nr:tRNA (adenosine(37)-N6)-threonylcarbamoyltransferase complex transferase subunit TsaD [Candidatus Omnitrophota bacterium]